jgi:hypothetical protein
MGDQGKGSACRGLGERDGATEEDPMRNVASGSDGASRKSAQGLPPFLRVLLALFRSRRTYRLCEWLHRTGELSTLGTREQFHE